MLETGLTLFPARGLDQSILVAVLVGILVLVVLTETLGWVWAGLVVPGYLASVFVIQPSSGVAICIEATITFLVCRLISDVWSRAGGWSAYFGRERFFLIVLVSVLVRQACELWLLADLMVWLESLTGLPLSHYQFSSIGLVLVPLLANMAWKLSLPRAVWQVGISVAITWVIVALVILRFTNLSYSSLELTYENVALDFLGSPKAYIILLSSAFIAARLNLSYGWDYNGILVPSLLALTWFEPRLAVATVVEALILLAATKATLALPMLRRRNLEGPRKLALVFSLGFVLKMIVGWVFVVWWPLLRVTDLLGFGYVLTSLIAVKMIALNRTGRVLLPALAVSLVGFFVGSGIGYGLEQVAPRAPLYKDVSALRDARTTRLVRDQRGIALMAAARARGSHAGADRRRSADELVSYRELWREIDRWLDADAPREQVAHLTVLAAATGLRLLPLAGPRACWGLVESEERLVAQRGWDPAILCPGARGPVLEVLHPRTDHPIEIAAVAACERTECVAVVFSGADVVADPRVEPAFIEVHRALLRRPVVEMRADRDATVGKPTLHLRSGLPDAVHVPALWPGAVEVSWVPPPRATTLWSAATSRAVLRVHPDDVWASLGSGRPPLDEQPGVSMFAWVEQWQLSRPQPAPPSETELRVLEVFVVTSLVARRTELFPVIGEFANALDHDLRWLADGAGADRGAWVLSGRADRGWVALAVAARPRVSLAIEAPRPRAEVGTGRLAAATWQSAEAEILLLDPEWADRDANANAAYGNAAAPGEVATAFHATHQAIARYFAEIPRGAIVQLRGFATWRPITHDVLVSLGSPLLDPSYIPPSIGDLVGKGGLLWQLGGDAHWAGGDEAMASLHARGTPQLLYAQAMDVPFASIWVSPEVRLRAVPQDTIDEVRDIALRMRATFIERPLADVVTTGLAPPTTPQVPSVSTVGGLALRYATSRDLAALAALLGDRRATTTLGWSPDLDLAYIVVETRTGTRITRTAAILGSPGTDICARIVPGPDATADVNRTLERWCLRLEITGESRSGSAPP